jgi:hypothetical protein
MSPVEDYISGFEGPQKEIMLYLHDLIMKHPGITTKISYGLPFYYRKSWICYLNPTKNGGVELAFTRGNELSNEQGLLDSKGRKQVSGITFYQINNLPHNSILEILQEAMLLDEKVPYSIRKKR